jgi:chromosome segregation and condensation protein ScpB
MSEENIAETSPHHPHEASPEEPKPRLDSAQLKAIVEALVFASPEPLTPKMLFKLLNDEPQEDVLAAVKALQQEYEQRGGLHLAEVAGGYQITTRCTTGSAVCFTSGRRRSCRCSRSRLSP